VLREVDLVSFGSEGDDLDPAGGNRPDVVALADALRPVGHFDLRLDRIGQGREVAFPLLLVDDQRPVGECDEPDLVTTDPRRLGGDDDVPPARTRRRDLPRETLERDQGAVAVPLLLEVGRVRELLGLGRTLVRALVWRAVEAGLAQQLLVERLLPAEGPEGQGSYADGSIRP
jgi:hypothetical protein